MRDISGSFQAALDSIYNFKPPKLASGHGSYPKLDATLTFHDKHLDPRLALKRVILAPSLVSDLVMAGQRALETYRERTDLELPSETESFLFPREHDEDIVNARAIGAVYESGIAEPAATIASMLLLHPNVPEWSNSMYFLEKRFTQHRDGALNENYTPLLARPYDDALKCQYVNMVDQDAWASMDEITKMRYRMAHQKFSRTAAWQMFFVRREARRALKRMDAAVLNNTSTYPTFRTQAAKLGEGNLDLPFSPDALETAWGMPLPAFMASTLQASGGPFPLRRSKRLASNVSESVKNSNSEEPPSRFKKRKTPRTSLAKSAQGEREWSAISIFSPSESVTTDEDIAMSILYRAWAHAVEKDATFIVLHCGTYERIAFRHRSTQTLLVSSLINVPNCSNPGYGAIHLGLFISILADILDRVAQMEEKTNETSKKRRRLSTNIVESRKRPRTRTATASEAAKKIIEQKQLQVVINEIKPRPLTLLRMQFSRFNSPVPASFLRYDLANNLKKLYKPTDYFIITITSYIGNGSTGDVHGAAMELLGVDGTVHSYANAVVKFASKPDQRQRLRHEFKVYERLKPLGITCIPEVFGLFKDIEGDTLALVMTHCGESLASRRPNLQESAFHVSKEERDKFVEGLQSIHAQGFRHRDIRPENLLVTEDGSAKIIDFDRASLDSREGTREREMKHLVEVLEGLDYGAVGVQFVSRGSFCQSESASTATSEGWEDSADNSDGSDVKGESKETSEEESESSDVSSESSEDGWSATT
ncbi:hypothetical protein H0H93_004865 [Arthromyces matolae]|nr:hypothetical protein H0H93_004865 [Arthromyces matolae]